MLKLERAERRMSSSMRGVGDLFRSGCLTLAFLSADVFTMDCFLVSSMDGESFRGVAICLIYSSTITSIGFGSLSSLLKGFHMSEISVIVSFSTRLSFSGFPTDGDLLLPAAEPGSNGRWTP